MNGPAFLVGWVLGVAVASGAIYAVANAANAATDSTASDSVSWLKIGLGVLLLGVARRNWAKRPKDGEPAPMPKWMGAIESITPVKAFGLAILLSVVNPKNLALTFGAAAGLAQVPDLSTEDAIVALAVFVVLASVSVAGAVLYDLFGGAGAKAKLDELKSWMTLHSAAVMAVLFLVFGVVLIAKGIGPLST